MQNKINKVLIVTRSQPRIFSTVIWIKVFWYSLFLLSFQFLFSWKFTLLLIKCVRNKNNFFAYYFNRLMTNRAKTDINCNILVELKLGLTLCRGFLFCVKSELFFDIQLRIVFKGCEALLLIGLPNTRSETE